MYSSCQNGDFNNNDSSDQSTTTEPPSRERGYLGVANTQRSLIDSIAAATNLDLSQQSLLLAAARQSMLTNFGASKSSLMASSDTATSSCSLDEQHSCCEQAKKRPRSTFPFGKCKVCSDKATGVHYGIATCEGCKGFFKRSILRNEYYRCFFGNNCLITPKNRNRCKACRFKRCVQVGMSIEGIKMGRIPNALKEKALKGLKTNKPEDSPVSSSSSPVQSPVRPNSQPSLSIGHIGGRKSKQLRSNDSDSENEASSEESRSERSLECLPSSSKKMRRFEEPPHAAQASSSSLWSSQPTSSSLNQPLTSNLMFATQSQQSSCNQLQHQANPSPSPPVVLGNQRYSSYLSMLYSMAAKKTTIQQQQEVLNAQSNSSTPRLASSSSSSPSASLNNDNQNFLVNLLRMYPAFLNSNLVTRIFQSSLIYSLADGLNETTYKMMSSILNEKIYQHMSEQTEFNKMCYERAKDLADESDQDEDDQDGQDENELGTDKVWPSLVETLPAFVEKMVAFARELQGLSDLAPADFSSIVNNRLFDYFLIINCDLLVDDESYIMLKNGIQYTRKYMNKISGKPKVDAIFAFANAFNSLNLTVKEKALFLAIVLTIPDASMRDSQILKNLNEYYTKSILHEFEVSKRDEGFVLELSKVLKMLNECKHIGSNI